jgi:hypothetical protein
VNYAVEIGSGAMILLPSFIKIDPGIQEVDKGDLQIHRHTRDRISLLKEAG